MTETVSIIIPTGQGQAILQYSAESDTLNTGVCSHS